jgi:hypothetical protein
VSPGLPQGRLAEAVERRLAGFGVDLAVVDDLDPGQQALVEVVQGVHRGGGGQLGQEIGADEAEEAFDLALGLR